MRYIFLYCLFFFTFCCNSFAINLTKNQCEKIGGTFTKAGCLIPGDAQKAKYKDKSLYTPNKEECYCQGGTWHNEQGCLAKISEDECRALGGEIQEGLGCIQKLTQEQCQALGGNYKEGNCSLATQPTPQPNPAVNRTCAKSRAGRLP